MELTRINQLRSLLPRSDLVVGYGSGVVIQDGYRTGASKMVDLLVLTHNREEFVHDLRRRKYISSTARRFASMVSPEVLFFPNISPYWGLSLKIGVVDSEQCIRGLSDWGESFYLPGRLQKPVAIVDSQDDSVLTRFRAAQETNRRSALTAAILNLPPDAAVAGFTLDDLFCSLVSLSYLGDIRVGIAENPLKIKNIVSAQHRLLESIYRPFFGTVGLSLRSDGRYTVSKTRKDLWNGLPESFRRSAIQLVDPHNALRATLSRINRRESVYQALVGVGTAGPCNSFQYLVRKVSKRFQ